MSKGTIIYIGGFELPDKNAAAHRVLNNGKIFRELGYKVVFIDIDKSLQFDSNILTTNKNIQGFDCWSVPYPRNNIEWFKYFTNINPFCTIFKNYNNIKLVIAYNYPSIALLRMKSYCCKNKSKIIADCTEWYNSEGKKFVFKFLKGLDTFLRMQIIQKRLDGIIVISRYLENYYCKCKNLIKIPPLVDLSEEKWKQDGSENDDEKIHFVYAGNPGKSKDKLNLIFEALHRLNAYCNYFFYIVGITEEQYLKEHEKHKKLLEDLGDRIVFLGQLTHVDSLKYVKLADFSIFVRGNTRATRAGFPTKFVESISCGTPVVTTNSSDLKEYIVDGVNGYFLRIDSMDRLTKDIEKILLLNKKEIKKVKDKCINVNTFDYRKYIDWTREYIEYIDNER